MKKFNIRKDISRVIDRKKSWIERKKILDL